MAGKSLLEISLLRQLGGRRTVPGTAEAGQKFQKAEPEESREERKAKALAGYPRGGATVQSLQNHPQRRHVRCGAGEQ